MNNSDFFKLGTTFRRIDDIRTLELNELGCWARIWLYGEAEPRTIGDGSYKGCLNHTNHEVVYLVDRSPDFGFRNLQRLMKKRIQQQEMEEL